MAVAAIFCLTACESISFKTTFSSNETEATITVTASTGVKWFSRAFPYDNIAQQFSDPVAQRNEVIAEYFKKRPEAATIYEYGNRTLTFTNDQLAKDKEGTWVIYVYNFKSNANEPDIVNAYTYDVKIK